MLLHSISFSPSPSSHPLHPQPHQQPTLPFQLHASHSTLLSFPVIALVCSRSRLPSIVSFITNYCIPSARQEKALQHTRFHRINPQTPYPHLDQHRAIIQLLLIQSRNAQCNSHNLHAPARPGPTLIQRIPLRRLHLIRATPIPAWTLHTIYQVPLTLACTKRAILHRNRAASLDASERNSSNTFSTSNKIPVLPLPRTQPTMSTTAQVQRPRRRAARRSRRPASFANAATWYVCRRAGSLQCI